MESQRGINARAWFYGTSFHSHAPRDSRGVRIPKEGNFLNASAWTLNPEVFRQVMTRDEYRATMLETQGWITAKGLMLDIVGKNLGNGIVEVTLKERG